jgi:hypothetical protein
MEGRPRGRFLLWAVPLVLFALPVLYVASLGVCVWMYRHGWLSEPVANVAYVFYEPLSLLADQSESFAHVLEWYVETCRELPP